MLGIRRTENEISNNRVGNRFHFMFPLLTPVMTSYSLFFGSLPLVSPSLQHTSACAR